VRAWQSLQARGLIDKFQAGSDLKVIFASCAEIKHLIKVMQDDFRFGAIDVGTQDVAILERYFNGSTADYFRGNHHFFHLLLGADDAHSDQLIQRFQAIKARAVAAHTNLGTFKSVDGHHVISEGLTKFGFGFAFKGLSELAKISATFE
jgi:hypothetical protein